MEPPIIQEIETLEFDISQYAGLEEEHFSVYKEEVKRAMRLIANTYGDIAHHFAIRETTFAYDRRKSHKGERIEIALPDDEIHYMLELDTITLNEWSLANTCRGIKYNLWGSFPDEGKKRYFKMCDFIFLTYCGQAYVSHIAKIGKFAEVPIDQFDIEPMMRAHRTIVELLIIKQKIQTYTPDHKNQQ